MLDKHIYYFEKKAYKCKIKEIVTVLISINFKEKIKCKTII